MRERLFLLVVAVLLFLPDLAGRVHLEADFLRQFHPWTQGCEISANPTLQDAFLIDTPLHKLYHESLRRGELFLWDPTVFCGYPTLPAARILYPPRLLLHFLLPPLWARECLIFLHLVLAGWSFLALARELGTSREAACLGACCWMLGGYGSTYLEYEFLTTTSVYLPLGFFCLDRLLRRGQIRWASLLGILAGLVALSGHWQFTLYSFLAMGAWTVWRTFEDGFQRRWKRALAALIGMLMGMVLVLPQLLSAVELLSLSQRPALSAEQNFGAARFLPENLLTLLIPEALGHPRAGFYLAPMGTGVQTMRELCGYVGLLPLLLALAGIGKRTRFFAVLALLCLAYAMDAPGARWVYNFVPGFRVLTPVRTMYLFAFSVSMLAAWGFDRTLSARVTGAMLGLVGLLGLTLVWVAWEVQNPLVLRGLVAHYGEGLMFSRPHYCDVAEYAQRVLTDMQRHYTFSAALLVPWLLGLAGALALHWGYRRIVVLTVALDLLLMAARFNPTFPAADVLPDAPALEAMREPRKQLHRCAGIGASIHPNLPSAYGLHEVSGYASLFPARYARLAAAVAGGPGTPVIADFGQAPNLTLPLARFLNLYYLYGDPFTPMPAWAGKPLHVPNLRVHPVPNPLPRYFLCYSAQVQNDPERVLASILDPNWDPAATVYLENGPERTGSGQGSVQVLQYDLTSVRLQVETSAPAFLVGSEVWYPGWRARVDGYEVPLYRANYAFRALDLLAGSHRVELEYRPTGWSWTWIVAATSGVFLVIGAIAGVGTRETSFKA